MHLRRLCCASLLSAHLGAAVPDPSRHLNAQPIVSGAALNGLYALEDWFFSWPEGLPPVTPFPFDEVASPPGVPGGRRFPSEKLPTELIDPWLSEGALLGQSAVRNGANITIDAINSHREGYITEYDFAQMASAGIQHVRLPVGWWAFASSPLPAESTLLPDPCYPEQQFVTVSSGMLETLLRTGQRHSVKFLVDMHAMPCGSSDGTYNGIFPANPQFFSNASARALGLDVVRNMMNWYRSLPDDLQPTVWGFTLLNEPGLGVVSSGAGINGGGVRKGNTALPDNKPVLQWLGQAVAIFKGALTDLTGAPRGPNMPLLYMNLHESAFPGPDSLGQMGEACKAFGLSGMPWAVFDVHHYFSWGGSDGTGIPAQNCSTDAALRAYVRETMETWTRQFNAVKTKNGMVNAACSEWSLSLHHKDHILPCTAPHALDIMYDEQVAAFGRASISNMMWGWRMPQGGTHERMWSLKYHLLGKH